MSKRYIDADALVKAIEDCSYATWSEGVNKAWWAQAVLVKDNLKRCIARQPAADVVEVVRCKDCAYYREETSYCLNPHCSSSFYGHRVKENHYCSYGERNEDDGN